MSNKSNQTGYVIVEKGFEYNDEIYYTPDSGGGSLVRIFTDRQAAEAELERLEQERWQTEREPGQYAYSPSDISSFTDEEIEEKLTAIFSLKKKANNREKRRAELEKELKKTLKGAVLEKAIEDTLNEEFGEETDTDFDIHDFCIPSNATDEQIKAVREVFDGLTFYEIQEAPLNWSSMAS